MSPAPDGASEGAAAAMVASSGGNGTALAWMRASSASSKNDVEVDEGVVRRSPLVKTLAPLVGFLRSRAGKSTTNINFKCNIVVLCVFFPFILDFNRRTSRGHTGRR